MSLNTWLVKNLQYMLSTFELFLVLLSLSWLLRWADFFAFFFFSELPGISCVQHSFVHLALQNTTASHAVLPILLSPPFVTTLSFFPSLLPLSLPPSSFPPSSYYLLLSIARELLGSDNPWYCPQCGEMREAVRTLSVCSLPKTLIIHLKR